VKTKLKKNLHAYSLLNCNQFDRFIADFLKAPMSKIVQYTGFENGDFRWMAL